MMMNQGRHAGVRLTGLAKSYGAVAAVRGVDIGIEPGETVALLGPNGAGKSTTIDMMLGLARPDTGSVSLFGLSPDEAVRAGRVSGMLQTGSLIQHLSVRELVVTIGSLYPDPLDVDTVLRTAGLTEIAGRRTTKLSGGQAQRVRLALALVGNSDLLVLDEPTAGLDVAARQELWDVMRRVTRSGKTVVFATHYLEEADTHADRVVLMSRGRVVADGPVTEVRAMTGNPVIRATLLDVDPATLASIPGVVSADRRGGAVELTCADSDTALRALLSRYPAALDIEVRRTSLEQVFMELTSESSDREGALL
jgi:ABC-2 type transport system ATP-binding protein